MLRERNSPNVLGIRRDSNARRQSQVRIRAIVPQPPQSEANPKAVYANVAALHFSRSYEVVREVAIQYPFVKFPDEAIVDPDPAADQSLLYVFLAGRQ